MIIGKYGKNVVGTTKLDINRLDGGFSAEVVGKMNRVGRMEALRYDNETQATNVLHRFNRFMGKVHTDRNEGFKKFNLKFDVIHPTDRTSSGNYYKKGYLKSRETKKIECWYIRVSEKV